MPDLVHGDLADYWMHYRQMTGLQSVWDPVAYKARLQHFAKRGAQVILVFEAGRLVASTVYFQISPDPVLGDGHGIRRAMARTCIFVDPDCKGRGIGAELHRATIAAGAAAGFSHLIDYSFATQEVQDWSASRPGMMVADVTGPAGEPVHVLALE